MYSHNWSPAGNRKKRVCWKKAGGDLRGRQQSRGEICQKRTVTASGDGSRNKGASESLSVLAPVAKKARTFLEWKEALRGSSRGENQSHLGKITM